MDVYNSYLAFIAVLIFFLGTCVFSFLNVIIYRVPRKMDFIRGHSICPACGHQLGALDLIPLFSYLFLGGKCRYCKVKIGARDTFIEFFGGGAALFCAWYYKEKPGVALTVFLFFCILTVVTFMDIDTMEIEDGCWIAVYVLAAAACFTMPEISFVSRLIGIVCVSVPMLLLTLAVPGAFGGGDIKLMGACGAFLGWKITLISAFIAILFGGMWGIGLLLGKKKSRKDHFAFGPFLCIGMVIGLLWGGQIISWYMGFLEI